MTKHILSFLQTKLRSTWTVKVIVLGLGALFVMSLGTYFSYTHRKTKLQIERNSSPFQQSSEDLRSLLGLSGNGVLGSWEPLGPPETYFLPSLDSAYYLFPIERQLSLREEFASILSVAMTNSKRRSISDLHSERKKAIGYLLFDLCYPPLETQRHVLYEEGLQALLECVAGEENKISEARISKKGVSIKGTLGGTSFALLFHASKVRESPMTFDLETLRYNEFGLSAFTRKLKDSFFDCSRKGVSERII